MALVVEPFCGRPNIRRLRIQVELHMRKVLQQTDEEERHLVVRELPNKVAALAHRIQKS